MLTYQAGLQPGTTYTATAVTNCAGGGQSAPGSLVFTTPAGNPPVNDDCTGALPLAVTMACIPVAVSNLNATHSDENYRTCYTFDGADVWYRLTVPANGVVSVAAGPVAGSAVTSAHVQLFTGSCGHLLAVACGGGAGVAYGQLRATGLVPGSTVCLAAWQPNTLAGGDFTLCIGTDDTCPLPTGLTATATSATTAAVSFALPAGSGTTYALTYTPAGGTAHTQAVMAAPVALSGLLPATAYTLTLTGTCAAPAVSGTVRTSFSTPPTPSCAAPALYAGNVGETTAGVGWAASAGGTGYTLTYQAAGGPLQTLAPAPTASPVQLTGLLPGTAYIVCATAACANGLASAAACLGFTTANCAPPTSAAIAALTPTSAMPTFTPGGAVGYTVRYAATGYPVQTLDSLSAPVALTGLRPGTAYTLTLLGTCAGGGTAQPLTLTFTTPATPAATRAAQAAAVGLYPNPARAQATLALPAEWPREPTTGTLYNVLGQTVRTLALPAGTTTTLDLRGLPPGSYWLRLYTAQSGVSKRLVVE